MIGATVRAPALAGVHHLKVAGAGPGPVAGVVLEPARLCPKRRWKECALAVSRSVVQLLGEPVLCVRRGVEGRYLVEPAMLVQPTRLHQIVPGVEFKAGDLIFSGHCFEFSEKSGTNTLTPLWWQDEHPRHLPDAVWLQA